METIIPYIGDYWNDIIHIVFVALSDLWKVFNRYKEYGEGWCGHPNYYRY